MDQCQSPEIDKLAASIIASQLTLEPAKRDATNPFFHSKYADLPAVWESLAPFRLNGIAITQSPMESPDGYIVLDTQLTHVSGQWMRSRLKMRVVKDDPQGAGSALTYARRYALGCMTGLVTDVDDDGHTASSPVNKQAVQPVPKAAQPKPVDTTAPFDTTGKWVVPFGKDKGKPICDVSDGGVEYLIKYYHGKLQDPANAGSRYRDEWEDAILAARAEMLSRFPESTG